MAILSLLLGLRAKGRRSCCENRKGFATTTTTSVVLGVSADKPRDRAKPTSRSRPPMAHRSGPDEDSRGLRAGRTHAGNPGGQSFQEFAVGIGWWPVSRANVAGQ